MVQGTTLAFAKLKKAMTQVPVLALPDFTKDFMVETDASGTILGAVLLQKGRPIAFYSQVLGPRARLKSVYERELMATTLAIQKWRPYLLGRHFIVRSDQKSLKFLLEQRMVTEEHQGWLSKLVGFDFDIQYRPGKENKTADSLSRSGEDDTCHALSLPQLEGLDNLDRDILKDPKINRIVNSLKERAADLEGYHVEGGKLLYHDRRVMPRASPWIPKLFHEFHKSTVGGHSGMLKTYQRMAVEFYWVRMQKEIAKMVSECEVCQRNKYSTLLPSGLLQLLELPEKVWDEVTM